MTEYIREFRVVLMQCGERYLEDNSSFFTQEVSQKVYETLIGKRIKF
jgi:hypothetical protein